MQPCTRPSGAQVLLDRHTRTAAPGAVHFYPKIGKTKVNVSEVSPPLDPFLSVPLEQHTPGSFSVLSMQ
jgi:hypothetical protein